MPDGNDDWAENRKYVLESLERIEKSLCMNSERQIRILEEVSALKVRVASISGIVALIVGAVSTLVTNLLTR